MALLPDEKDFDKRWLHESTKEHQLSVIADLAAVREFAYKSFDNIDKDKNGFLEVHELTAELDGERLNNREKSFVMFLLNNREQISQMNDEGRSAPIDGITRADLEQYFALLASIL